MRKLKIFSYQNPETLQNAVNDFIAEISGNIGAVYSSYTQSSVVMENNPGQGMMAITTYTAWISYYETIID